MPRLAPLFLLCLYASGCDRLRTEQTSVTVKLPPPKDAASPGFSTTVANSTR